MLSVKVSKFIHCYGLIMSIKKQTKPVPTHIADSVVADQVVCPVTSITGIWKLRIAAGATTVTNALPGHLLHYVIFGAYTMIVNGKEYQVRAGDIIHYFGTEEVAAINKGEEVQFYSLAFEAPLIQVPNDTTRVIRGEDNTLKAFRHIYELAGCKDMSTVCESYMELFNILKVVADHVPEGMADGSDNLWTRLERQIRNKRDFRASVPELCEKSHVSPSTLHRVCVKITGVSPAKRLMQMRMEEAKGLLLYSDMSATSIALELGYSRLHEFSRDVKKYFGASPKLLRKP